MTVSRFVDLPRTAAGDAVAVPGAGRDQIELLPLTTFVLWGGCCLIGVLGFVLPYLRPQAAAPVETMKLEVLHVELADMPEALNLASFSTELSAEPPPPDAVAQPEIAPLLAVAQPSPAIAFALPIEGPVRIVENRAAAYTRPDRNESAAIASLPVQPLVFGVGEGRQPKPDYPLRARRERQEGTVTVRLTVGENGRVTAAEAVIPSAWPLLNEAALRAVQERWHFAPGAPRHYEIPIRFELKK